MRMRFRFLGVLRTGAFAMVALLFVGCESTPNINQGALPSPTLINIETLSNRADLVSGGDVLVRITVPANTTAQGLHVTLGSRDVTSQFAMRSDGRILGLLTGLDEGSNNLAADLSGEHTASLTITNHKLGGPVFSGPQVKPFICATPTPTAGNDTTPATSASGLPTAAIDDQCNIATDVKLFYRSTTTGCSNARPDPSPPSQPPANACFKPYDPATTPADLAMTTTDTGVTVPYIVRVERGTINRGIYDIAVLFDPKADDVTRGWSPFAPQPGWNRKVLYSFGASTGQPRLQFRSSQLWNDDIALSRGFMVAVNSMTDSRFNSNRVLMTETLMMMKEKIIDTFGEVKFVMGNGCSGGSINQMMAASIFPGLLDGIQPTCTYPDAETTGLEVFDCLQLIRAYSSAPWLDLVKDLTQAQIDEKKAAINGHVDPLGCRAWVRGFANVIRAGQYVPYDVDEVTGVFKPSASGSINNCGLPASMIYNPVSKLDGVRCTGGDYAISIWGKVKDTNRPRTTGDNIGVQYGLKALLSGAITPLEFVVINENVGGVDPDTGELRAARLEADPDALEIAYRAGIVSDASHLASTAIIDLRGWDDSGIHHQWRSFALRDRLDAANRGHKNYVMWRYGTGLEPTPALFVESFLVMDKWLSALKSDGGGGALSARVAAARPEAAFDFCYLGNDLTTKVKDAALCNADARLKPASSPRQVAGGPLAENILKCELKPIVPADYAGKLDAALIARLEAVFPKGVCDWTEPGVGQQPAESPLDFSAGPGGRPLGTPPLTKNGR